MKRIIRNIYDEVVYRHAALKTNNNQVLFHLCSDTNYVEVIENMNSGEFVLGGEYQAIVVYTDKLKTNVKCKRKGVSFVKKETAEYYSYLGSAGVIVFDESLTYKIIKRKEQTLIGYISTRTNEHQSGRIVHRNHLQCDYLTKLNMDNSISAVLRVYSGFLLKVNNLQDIIGLVSSILNEDGINATEYRSKPVKVLFGGKLNNVKIKTYMNEFIRENYVSIDECIILAHNSRGKKSLELWSETLPSNVVLLKNKANIFGRINSRVLLFISHFSNNMEYMVFKELKTLYQKEFMSLLPNVHISKIIFMSNYDNHYSKVYGSSTVDKEYYKINKLITGYQISQHKIKKFNGFMIKAFKEINEYNADFIDEYIKDIDNYYSNNIKITNIITKFNNKNNVILAKFIALVKSDPIIDTKDLNLCIDELDNIGTIKSFRISNIYSIIFCNIKLSIKDLHMLPIHNKIVFKLKLSNNNGLVVGAKYNFYSGNKCSYKRSKLFINSEGNTTLYFRQSQRNTLYLTVRRNIITDAPYMQTKINTAYYISKLPILNKVILLYEKEGERYEESASILFEKLLDKGYENIYFIYDKKNKYYNTIDGKYKKHIIQKGSFKHYLLFFCCKIFIGSETMGHAIDLRIANKQAQKKLVSKNNNFIFLQHGVMYMISLDSESRTAFKPMRTNGIYRVVASSQEEANHFINIGNHKEEHIYISGLPKFDKSELLPGADKIVIMPTWRPWEYNIINGKFTDSKYYKMLERIVEVIPDELKDKIVILPHPLFNKSVNDAEFPLRKYLNTVDKYDDVLKKTKILITDYSSIAYDAFYRGSNVIFYWEELDESICNYGPSTKLMLNNHNIFGDICYDNKQLSNVLEKNYISKQNHEHLSNYRKIVEFKDNKNTDRLIEMLKKDKLI